MPREPVRKRRLLFNCDGHSVWAQAQGDLGKWIDNVFTGLVDSQVDALLWCDGAGGNTANYDSRVLELTGLRAGKTDASLVRAIAQGNDPPKLVVTAAHQRGLDVFYSFRINDCHDAFMPEELPSYKIEHPEWQISRQARYGPHTALDFAHPGVRDLKLRVIEELFARYDFDGLEIDLLRGPPFFRPHYEPRHHYLLTDLLRAVRHSLDDRARERGRPVELAVRVGENLTACRLDGFDLQTWLAEDLFDVLILGSGTIDIEVEEFRVLCAGSRVRVYPCLYGWPSRYSPVPAPLARGLAANYWQQGADGLYLFNWFPHEAKSRYQIELLRQVGDPVTLEGRALMFAADRGFADRPDDYYPHNWLFAPLPAELWPTQTGAALQVPVRIGARIHGTSALRVEVADLGEREVLVSVAGRALGSLRPAEDQAWTADLPADVLRQGLNHIGLSLRPPAGVGPPPRIEAVEVHVPGAP